MEALAAEDVSAGGHDLLQGEPDGLERVPEQGVPYGLELLHALPRRLDQILRPQLQRPPPGRRDRD